MGDTIRYILVLIIGLFPIAFGIWYVVNPESVKEFCKRNPGFDRRGQTVNEPKWSIRLMGVIGIIIGLLFEIGVAVIAGFIQ